MDVRIQEAAKDAQQFIYDKATENKFGDITVTITLKDGVPVKITRTFTEHFVQRKTTALVVEK